MASLNYYKECLKVLDSLHTTHPTFSLGRHLSTALSDYGDIWGIPNKELLFALQKYEAEMELNTPNSASHEQFVDKVVKDALDMDHLLDEEQEDNDY